MPTHARLPKYLRDIDPNDPDSYSECIRGCFWETYQIVDAPAGVDVPSIKEMIAYHPSFRFADRVMDVVIHCSWVRPKNAPDAEPALVYRYHNAWYSGFGGVEDYIRIEGRDIPRFIAKVRYVLSTLEKRRTAERAEKQGRVDTRSSNLHYEDARQPSAVCSSSPKCSIESAGKEPGNVITGSLS